MLSGVKSLRTSVEIDNDDIYIHRLKEETLQQFFRKDIVFNRCLTKTDAEGFLKRAAVF